MPKRSLVLNQQTENALVRLSRKRDTPVAVLIRKAVEKYLAENGEVVDSTVSWGGNRRDTPDDETKS